MLHRFCKKHNHLFSKIILYRNTKNCFKNFTFLFQIINYKFEFYFNTGMLNLFSYLKLFILNNPKFNLINQPNLSEVLKKISKKITYIIKWIQNLWIRKFEEECSIEEAKRKDKRKLQDQILTYCSLLLKENTFTGSPFLYNFFKKCFYIK